MIAIVLEMGRAIGAFLLFAIVGCGGGTRPTFYETLTTRGRADLQCHDVRVSVLGAGGYRLRGCGRYQSYACQQIVGYRGVRLANDLCLPTGTGVDEASLADRIADDADTAAILDRVGPALGACAPQIEIVAIEVRVDAAGHIVGGAAEDLDASQGACIRSVLEPVTVAARGREHELEVIVARAR